MKLNVGDFVKTTSGCLGSIQKITKDGEGEDLYWLDKTGAYVFSKEELELIK